MIPERYSISKTTVLGAAAALILIVCVIAVALHFLQNHFLQTTEDQNPKAPAHSPRAQAEFENGALEKAFRAKQLSQLSTYHWESEQKEFARIPIERAIEILAQKEDKRGQQ